VDQSLRIQTKLNLLEGKVSSFTRKESTFSFVSALYDESMLVSRNRGGGADPESGIHR
jgi:hypothetical protein